MWDGWPEHTTTAGCVLRNDQDHIQARDVTKAAGLARLQCESGTEPSLAAGAA